MVGPVSKKREAEHREEMVAAPTDRFFHNITESP
jgi:hypothetical protein